MSQLTILYLIPSGLGQPEPSQFLPQGQLTIIRQIKYFIVENSKTARAFLKSCEIATPQSDIIVLEIDKHETTANPKQFFDKIPKGENIGLLSEAGCPGVADPGAIFVAYAHQQKIKVKPLVGPSSILLSLMASGLNGQQFTFNGYLPIDQQQRIAKLQAIEKQAKSKRETQIFIETPYRNNALLKDILTVCNNETKLCISSNLDTEKEYIKTQSIQQWKKDSIDLHKSPTVFLLL